MSQLAESSLCIPQAIFGASVEFCCRTDRISSSNNERKKNGQSKQAIRSEKNALLKMEDRLFFFYVR